MPDSHLALRFIFNVTQNENKLVQDPNKLVYRRDYR